MQVSALSRHTNAFSCLFLISFIPPCSSAPQLTPPKFVVPPRALSPVTGDNPILEPVVEVTSPKSPDTSTNEDKEESAESSSSEAVVSRQQSDESRQSRRIKTISSVESVV